MKKISVIFIAVLLVLLAGCGYSANYIDPEDRRIVTSVGIIKQNDEVVCIIEAPDADENKEDGITSFRASGATLSEAIDKAVKKIAGETIFSQCPIILIDDSTDNEVMEQVFDLCISEYDFSLSIQLINCNVAEIYDRKTPESSLGYEILKTVNYADKDKKITKYGRFANILNDNVNASKFYVPHLIISDGSLEIDGLSVYRDGLKTNFVNIKVVENDIS